MKQIFKPWPIFILGLLTIILFWQNYVPGTFLTGWDNLHPEFDFWLNIKRSLFAVWQEYQSLGLLGGMGHASDLVRQLFLWILSFALPTSLLRYVWTFLMLFIGSAGAYYLIRFFLNNSRVAKAQGLPAARTSSEETRLEGAPTGKELLTGPALLGALFYLLNLATIQTFFAPFEAFISHFGFLPWLLFSGLLYFNHQTKKHLLFFVFTLLLATPAAYIPTLFVVYVLALTLLAGTHIAQELFHRKSIKHSVLSAVKMYSVILLINSFWLLPFFYFTATNSSVNLSSKINQMATETIFLQNKEFGTLTDVILLKGFWFNNVDPNQQGEFDYMLKPWREHLDSPIISTLGFLLFGITLFGAFVSLRKRRLIPFFVLFLFSFSMLATATPPFSWFDELFRKIPLFTQAFRFPFTKFSVLTALTYSVFFAIGAKTLVKLIESRIKNYESWIKTITLSLAFLILASCFILVTLPAFQGNLLYQKNRLNIPQEYFDTFSFFKTQDPNTRIANFPQHTFWGWNFYSWGYGGSGFLWYGIEQPILDRAFDVWSKTSEQYYFETSQALYSKNPKLLESVLNKYQINWLMVDKNVIYPPSPKALFVEELEELIKEIPSMSKTKTFGNIDIYKVTLSDKPKSFVFTSTLGLESSPTEWSDRDILYEAHNTYITSPNAVSKKAIYPFKSLFSGKTQKERSFTLNDTGDFIEIRSILPKRDSELTLTLPNFLQEEIIPAVLTTQKQPNGSVTVDMFLNTPSVSVGNTGISSIQKAITLYEIASGTAFPLDLNINGISSFTIENRTKKVATTFLSLTQSNSFVLSDKTRSIETTISPPEIKQTLGVIKQTITLPPNTDNTSEEILVRYPKITDENLSILIQPETVTLEENCYSIRLGTRESISNSLLLDGTKNKLQVTSKDTTSCLNFYKGTLPHSLGYALFVNHSNVEGREFHFWVLNEEQQYAPIDTYLSRNQELETFILPPQDTFGKAYSFHFENVSIGKELTVNRLGELSLYPIPYNFLQGIKLTNSNSAEKAKSTTNPEMIVTHPNESLYVVNDYTGLGSKNELLVLSQSYDNGWKAYEVMSYESGVMSKLQTFFPFLFGKELKNHVMVNNWENGWILDNSELRVNNSELIIVYLPQYLEYLGFFLVFGTIVFAFLHSSHLTNKDL